MPQVLLLIVVLAPLPFGSNRPWAWSLLALATGALLVPWAWRHGARTGAPAVVAARRVRGPALLFLLVCAYAAFQAVPGLPPGWPTPTGSCRPRCSASRLTIASASIPRPPPPR